jgi:hypothetical protein
MRRALLGSLLLLSTVACGGSSTPTPPTASAAVIVVRAPASIRALPCTTCVDPTDVLAFVSLAIEETAGVGGEVTVIGVIVQNAAGVVLEGPGTLVLENFLRGGASTNRVSGWGTLTLPQIGAHIPGALRNQLPATMRLTVTFRDDRGNPTSTVLSVDVS